MTSLADRHLYPIFMLPSKLLSKFRGWIYGYTRLLLGMVCSVSCLFCVFTFIWYLTFRGLYGFLINLQLCQQPTGCGRSDGDDDDNDLTIEYTDYQTGKRGSFLTRCRAQAELIQQTLKKNRTNGDKSPNGHCPKTNGNSSTSCDINEENNGNNQHHHHHHHHRCHKSNHNHNHHHQHQHHSPSKENSAHSGLLVRNSSYVSEIYYDENGHKIGEQIYLTNDSDGLEESYFQFKVNDYQHLKELGALSTSVLIEEDPPLDGGEKLGAQADVESFPLADEPDEEDKHVTTTTGEGGEDFEDKIGGSGDDNGVSVTKDQNNFHLSVVHSPESTTSYCGSILADEPINIFEDDYSAKTLIINENNETLTRSTTTTINKPTNQQLLLPLIKTESLENHSSNNNYPDNICSNTTSQVQLDKYPSESIKEEKTKELTINLVTIPETSVNCNFNDKKNGVQLNGNATGETKITTTTTASNGNDSKSKSLNGADKSQDNNLIKDQPMGPAKRPKRRRRLNNNYNRSKTS